MNELTIEDLLEARGYRYIMYQYGYGINKWQKGDKDDKFLQIILVDNDGRIVGKPCVHVVGDIEYEDEAHGLWDAWCQLQYDLEWVRGNCDC